MNLLVDTHVLLWWFLDVNLVRPAARALIEDPSNRVVASVASVWEISIKRSVGKLDAPDDLAGALRATGIEPLPIGVAHAERVASLPLHHRDPFDRLIVAQALVEGLTIVTRDRRLEAYEVPLLAA